MLTNKWKKVPQGAVFVEEVPEHLKCPVCKIPMSEACELRCLCQATLCKGCTKRECPLCNGSSFNHSPVVLVQRTVKALKVKCPCCTVWVGELSDYSDHTELCSRQEWECTVCNVKTTGEQKKAHVHCRKCSYTGAPGTHEHCSRCEWHGHPSAKEKHQRCRMAPHCRFVGCGRAKSYHEEECVHCRVEPLYKLINDLTATVNKQAARIDEQEVRIEQLQMVAAGRA